MNDANRDLLVLSKTAHLSQAELDCQLAMLNKLLYEIETWGTFTAVNEIIDINRRKTIRKPYLIEKILRERTQKPFVFTCNKN